MAFKRTSINIFGFCLIWPESEGMILWWCLRPDGILWICFHYTFIIWKHKFWHVIFSELSLFDKDGNKLGFCWKTKYFMRCDEKEEKSFERLSKIENNFLFSFSLCLWFSQKYNWINDSEIEWLGILKQITPLVPERIVKNEDLKQI